jgi:hypothetical protein
MADQPPTYRPFKVLALGLPRTGTLSMAHALTRLGCEDVFHGVTKTSAEDWRRLSAAADATFPALGKTAAPSYTRADWDRVFAASDAVADIGALFARELVAAYPDVKVVLVHRPFDAWSRSMDTIVGIMFNPAAALIAGYVEPLMGQAPRLGASRRMLLGWAGVRDVAELQPKKRELFDAHYRDLTAMVPPEKLLHYRMGDGWEPLCKFLDVPVPDEPFPHVNEASEITKMWREGSRRQLASFGLFLLRYAAPVVLAIGAGLWIYGKA